MIPSMIKPRPTIFDGVTVSWNRKLLRIITNELLAKQTGMGELFIGEG